MGVPSHWSVVGAWVEVVGRGWMVGGGRWAEAGGQTWVEVGGGGGR